MSCYAESVGTVTFGWSELAVGWREADSLALTGRGADRERGVVEIVMEKGREMEGG